MWRSRIVETLRIRLTYAAMSLVVAVQTLAMVVAPAPDSKITMAARELLHPYITLFDMSPNWGFFAPNVFLGAQFRYVVEDAEGRRRMFIPADTLSRYRPEAFWFKDHYKAVMKAPQLFAKACAWELCRQHADLNPVSISLLEAQQKPFGPEDWINGKHPLDDEHVIITILDVIPCPRQ
jgi:hypothetical protein